jgi:uncharacterized membrane protein YqaE (UPF0057 family)
VSRFDIWRMTCLYLMPPIEAVFKEIGRQSRFAIAMLKTAGLSR